MWGISADSPHSIGQDGIQHQADWQAIGWGKVQGTGQLASQCAVWVHAPMDLS